MSSFEVGESNNKLITIDNQDIDSYRDKMTMLVAVYQKLIASPLPILFRLDEW